MEKIKKFVWITTDHQLYQPHLKLNGDQYRLKNLERVCENGIQFTNDYCPMPLCAPSRSSMMTGVYPHKYGIVGNGFGRYGELDHCVEELSPDLPFFNKPLKEAGFKTAWFGKWHCGLNSGPHDCGFEGLNLTGFGNVYGCPEYKEYLEKHGLVESVVQIEWNARLMPVNGMTFTGREVKDGVCPPSEHSGHMLTPRQGHESYFLSELACDWLRQQDKDQSFVLKVDLFGPHQPYDVAEPYYNTVDPDKIKLSPSFYQELDETMPDTYRSSVRRWPFLQHVNTPESTWRQQLARAYEHSMMVDEAWGKILDTLDELGIADETCVIITSDHGDSLASHSGLYNKDCILTEETTNVMLAVSAPGLPKGVKDNRLASGLDIVPTIYELAGMEPLDGWDGMSLLGDEKRDSLMVEEYGENRSNQFQRMVVSGSWRYMAHLNEVDELYDLEEDPYQARNMIFDLDKAEKLREMRNKLLYNMEKFEDNSPFSEELKKQIKSKLESPNEYRFAAKTRITFEYM